MTIFAPAARRSLFVDWAFFDGSEISSEFVGGQCASWRLPPKAAVSAYRRHSFVEGIRNGGLDFVKAAERSSVGHGDCLLNDGFFSFAVVRQIKFLFYLFFQCYRNYFFSHSLRGNKHIQEINKCKNQ